MNKGIGLVFLILLNANIFAQNSVNVAVLPLWFSGDEETLASLSNDAIQENIQWIIRSVPGYNVVVSDVYPQNQSELRRYLGNHDVDVIILCRLDVDLRDQKYTLSLIVQDAVNDEIRAIKKGTVNKTIELLTLANNLTESLLEDYLEQPVEFGSLRFNNLGLQKYSYDIFIDDVYYGENIQLIDRFLAGDYTIQIIQKNKEDRLLVLNRKVSIAPGDMTQLDFQIQEYGYVNISRSGADIPISVHLDGEPFYFFELNRNCPLPAGNHTVDIYVSTPYGEFDYLSDSIELDINYALVTNVTVTAKEIGKSINLIPNFEDLDYAVYINSELIGQNLTRIENLETGENTISIHQLKVDGSEIEVYNDVLEVNRSSEINIEFKLYRGGGFEPEDGKKQSDLSWELQFLGGSFVSAGVNYLFCDNRIGTGALLGISANGETADLTANLKTYYLPFKDWTFDPYAGLGYFLATDFQTQESMVGPMFGVTWHKSLWYISSFFAEAGFFYNFHDERIHFRIMLGCRFL